MGERVTTEFPRRSAIIAAAVALVVVLVVTALSVALARPRGDRDWVEHLAIMPEIDLREDGFAMGLVTDWSYDAEGPVDKAYTTAAESFADLRDVWFVIEPHPGMKAMAHTLVLFEFADDRIVGLTVEARREADEKYSALWGAFNRFELAYVWSSARDLLARRAVMLDHEVLVYPLALSEEQKLAFLRGVLEKTISVRNEPRFYNTLVSNCTNELAKTAGLDWHYAFVMTGYSAERLHRLGLIPGAEIDVVREQARLTQQIKDWSGLPSREFDRALLAELRARHADIDAVGQPAS